jgi:hypothetical protein
LVEGVAEADYVGHLVDADFKRGVEDIAARRVGVEIRHVVDDFSCRWSEIIIKGAGRCVRDRRVRCVVYVRDEEVQIGVSET